MRTPRPVPAPLTGEPFTVAAALELGVSRGRLRSSLWRPVCSGVLVARDTPDSFELFLSAAKLIVPEGALISGRAAAWLHGIDIRQRSGEPLDITLDRSWAPSGRGVLVPHRAPLPDEELELADGGAESPMESRLRMVLVIDAGLPRRETQYAVPYGDEGRELRLDIAYPGPHLGVEYHGLWQADGERPTMDQRRNNTLIGERWQVLQYWNDDYRDRRATIVRDVTAYLRSAA